MEGRGVEDGKEETYSSFVNVRTQSISFISQRLTNESALPTAKYLCKEKEFPATSPKHLTIIYSEVYSSDLLLITFLQKGNLHILNQYNTQSILYHIERHTFPRGQLQYNNNLLYEP